MKNINIQKFSAGPVSEYIHQIYVRTNWATSYTVDLFTIEVSIGGHATTLTLTPTSSCTLYPFGPTSTNSWGEETTTISSWGGYGSVDTVDVEATVNNTSVAMKTTGMTLNSYTIDEVYFNTRGGGGKVAITLNVSQNGAAAFQDRYSDAIGYYTNHGLWSMADWVLDGNEYKISRIPVLDSAELEEWYGSNKRHIGWSCDALSPSNYTIDELASLRISASNISNFIGIDFWAIVEDIPSSDDNNSIGTILYNNMKLKDLWLGTHEIIKVIYNKCVLYEKLDKLVGPFTNAELANYTHAQLSLSTHEELRGPAEIYSFTIDGTSYNFEDGMTWREFVNSSYNTDGMFSILANAQVSYGHGVTVADMQGNYVEVDAKIENGSTYQGLTCCFEKGTQVLTSLNGNTKNIEDIQPGDNIISYNEDTKEFFETKVLSLKNNPNVIDVAEIYLENGNYIRMNAYHPILTIDGYHSITNYEGLPTLLISDQIVTYNGVSKIKEIRRYKQEAELMYNLCIDNKYHNYIANNMVVHNAPCAVA